MHRSPRFIRFLSGGLRPFLAPFRISVSGWENLPPGPCLLIANHNIGAAIEILGLLRSWNEHFPNRVAYGLGHRFSFRIPLLKRFVQAIGSVPATRENAKNVLDSGADLIIFPGGNWQATRSFTEKSICDFGERRGWIDIAKASGVPIVPLAIRGSHSVNPVLIRSRFLAKALGLEMIFSIRWFPVTVGQLVWAGLFYFSAGKNLPPVFALLTTLSVFILTPLIPIWPSRVSMKFLEPFSDGLDESVLISSVEKSISRFTSS